MGHLLIGVTVGLFLGVGIGFIPLNDDDSLNDVSDDEG